MAVFLDLENIALGAKDAQFPAFEIRKVRARKFNRTRESMRCAGEGGNRPRGRRRQSPARLVRGPRVTDTVSERESRLVGGSRAVRFPASRTPKAPVTTGGVRIERAD